MTRVIQMRAHRRARTTSSKGSATATRIAIRTEEVVVTTKRAKKLVGQPAKWTQEASKTAVNMVALVLMANRSTNQRDSMVVQSRTNLQLLKAITTLVTMTTHPWWLLDPLRLDSALHHLLTKPQVSFEGTKVCLLTVRRLSRLQRMASQGLPHLGSMVSKSLVYDMFKV